MKWPHTADDYRVGQRLRLPPLCGGQCCFPALWDGVPPEPGSSVTLASSWGSEAGFSLAGFAISCGLSGRGRLLTSLPSPNAGLGISPGLKSVSNAYRKYLLRCFSPWGRRPSSVAGRAEQIYLGAPHVPLLPKFCPTVPFHMTQSAVPHASLLPLCHLRPCGL